MSEAQIVVTMRAVDRATPALEELTATFDRLNRSVARAGVAAVRLTWAFMKLRWWSDYRASFFDPQAALAIIEGRFGNAAAGLVG